MRRLTGHGGALAALLLGCTLGCGPGDDDPSWEPAFDATDIGWMMNVWGSGASDLYAVGGAPQDGLVMHFDGEAWAPLDTGIDTPLLNWVHGFSAQDITIVGNAGTVLHYDGSGWTQQDTPTIEDLWGVWGAAPDDLWAVGGRGREDGQATLLHYDGDDWSAQTIPPLQRAGVNAFFKIWGTGASNIYAVGQKGAVLHYDGSEWTEELVGASVDLISLWGTGPENIVAVGGRGSGIVSIWNGAEWRTESLAPLPGLNGVWTRQPGMVHAVGTVGTLITLDTDTLEVVQSYAGATEDFHAVFSADGETLTAVGGNLFAVDGPYRGLAYQRGLNEDE